MSKKPVCLSRLIFGFSLLIMVPALFYLVALPAQNARACDGGEQQVGFMLQGPSSQPLVRPSTYSGFQ